jgi:hypothetical protein
MKKEIMFEITESVDSGFEARALGHSIYTQCDDYDDFADILRDAVRCHFDDDDAMPSLIRMRFVKNEVIAV